MSGSTRIARRSGKYAAHAVVVTTRHHSRILIRVSPDAAKDKNEIRLLFGWQDPRRVPINHRRASRIAPDRSRSVYLSVSAPLGSHSSRCGGVCYGVSKG